MINQKPLLKLIALKYFVRQIKFLLSTVEKLFLLLVIKQNFLSFANNFIIKTHAWTNTWTKAIIKLNKNWE